jgi:hypothetical protein
LNHRFCQVLTMLPITPKQRNRQTEKILCQIRKPKKSQVIFRSMEVSRGNSIRNFPM